MIQIVNMLNNIEKEVDLERQGMLRIKRFAGNTSQITDDRWYQARAHRIPKSKANLDDVSQMGET